MLLCQDQDISQHSSTSRQPKPTKNQKHSQLHLLHFCFFASPLELVVFPKIRLTDEFHALFRSVHIKKYKHLANTGAPLIVTKDLYNAKIFMFEPVEMSIQEEDWKFDWPRLARALSIAADKFKLAAAAIHFLNCYTRLIKCTMNHHVGVLMVA